MGVSRRQFLHWSAVAAAGMSASTSMSSYAKGLHTLPEQSAHEDARSLKLYNLHTGERANVTYWEQGEYHVDGLAELYLLMRDHRQNEVAAIDVRLLDQLHNVSRLLNNDREIYLISAFRSEKTNTMLRGKSRNVAKHSLHMKGQALDFRIPKLNLRHVHKAALASASGGVGYYPNSGYLHMDIGRRRRWVV